MLHVVMLFDLFDIVLFLLLFFLSGYDEALSKLMRASKRAKKAEVRSRRHEAISTGQVATRIPGLTHIKSTSLMLGHAANPRARQRPEQFT